MIMIDIAVPSLGKSFDFCLDDEKRVDSLLSELIQLITDQEDSILRGEVKELWLCEMEGGLILNRDRSLAEQGIASGAELLLI
ncbi:MAG: EsaB/YukD family protein [Lachnospiraceae bacterium]|jgi:transcription initiation factor TFIID subunit TAF12|nr:EsaB/YukD family protein [Lachnospiraceae bacterium]